MKGIVFTEFTEMVEAKFGAETLERIIDEAALPSGAAYTVVGTYPHAELVTLVVRLSSATGVPVPELIRAFGRHLFGRFVQGYPRFFEGSSTAFGFLSRVDGYIHVEVRKLYPDAELPKFECKQLSPDQMELVYRSQRQFADLAEGLIAGCIEHYKERIDVRRENLAADSGAAARFVLTRRGGA